MCVDRHIYILLLCTYIYFIHQHILWILYDSSLIPFFLSFAEKRKSRKYWMHCIHSFNTLCFLFILLNVCNCLFSLSTCTIFSLHSLYNDHFLIFFVLIFLHTLLTYFLFNAFHVHSLVTTHRRVIGEKEILWNKTGYNLYLSFLYIITTPRALFFFHFGIGINRQRKTQERKWRNKSRRNGKLFPLFTGFSISVVLL